MKVSELVIGNHYIDKDYPEETCQYLGILKRGIFKGLHDFDGVGYLDPGMVCTDQEIEEDIKPNEINSQPEDDMKNLISFNITDHKFSDNDIIIGDKAGPYINIYVKDTVEISGIVRLNRLDVIALAKAYDLDEDDLK